MEKYGFVYIWRDRKHKRYYIGCHWGYIDDGYICSSVWMRNSYKRRPQDFKRRILEIVKENDNIYDIEHKWLSFIKIEELGKRYYNLQNRRFNHWSNTDNYNEIYKKLEIKNNEPRECRLETRKKLGKNSEGRIWINKDNQNKFIKKKN